MDARLAKRATSPRYTFTQAAALVGRPADTIRRWSVGNPRRYRDQHVVDEPLIEVDGERGAGKLPLSFLNLLELQMLSRYRDDAALQAIRPALAYAAAALHVPRPLLTVQFRVHGGELFTKFAETRESREILVNATRGGQVSLADVVAEATDNIDYTAETAHRLWPRTRRVPVFVDTRIASGQPITAETGVRVDAIVARADDGYERDEIAEDTGATRAEVDAALALAA